jgi:hypothetical protein
VNGPAPVMRYASGPPVRDAFRCACCGREVVTGMEGLFTDPRAGSPRRFCGLLLGLMIKNEVRALVVCGGRSPLS